MTHLDRWHSLALGVALTCVLACGGSGGGHDAPPPDIHVAGFEFNGTANVAMTWKNGSPTPLTDGTQDAKALSVSVSGGDVYAAGGQGNLAGVGVATYWKNGVPVALTDGSKQAMAESITLSGGDVYVAGYESGASGDVVLYWKNGVAVPLTDGTSTGEARSIALVGGDVYVAGWTYETVEVSPGSYATAPVAKIWKNGVLTRLSDAGSSSAVAESIVVSGGDVYVAGFSAPHDGRPSVPYIAQYWKNGLAIPLTDGTFGAKAFAIDVTRDPSAGEIVHAAGFTTAGAGNMATVWQDGAPVRWTAGHTIALILGLKVSGSNRYAVGREGNQAMLWVNGTRRPLTEGKGEAEACGIFLAAPR